MKFFPVALLSALLISSALFPAYTIKKSLFGVGYIEPGKTQFTVTPRYHDITEEAKKYFTLLQAPARIMYKDNKIPHEILSLEDPQPGVTKQIITQFDDGTNSYIQIDFEEGGGIIKPGNSIIVGPTKIIPQKSSPHVIQAVWGGRKLTNGHWTLQKGYNDITNALRNSITKDNKDFTVSNNVLSSSYTNPETQKIETIKDPVVGVHKQLIVAYDNKGTRNLGICFLIGFKVETCLVNGNIHRPQQATFLSNLYRYLGIPAALGVLGITLGKTWNKFRHPGPGIEKDHIV